MQLKTKLYDFHVSCSAKMVDFAGFSMPLYYKSQLKEHNAVREYAGMFDVSHMLVIDIIGEDSIKFAQYLFSNDINKISLSQSMYTLMLNKEGKIVDDLIVYFLNKQKIRIVVNASLRDSDFEFIKKAASGFLVEILKREDFGIIAVQGPWAIKKTTETFKDLGIAMPQLEHFGVLEFDDFTIARTGYTGEDGFEIIIKLSRIEELWNKLYKNNILPVGLGARDSLRLEAGMSLYGNEMDENTYPFNCSLIWAVDLNNEQRDFIGKKAIIENKPFKSTKHVGLILDRSCGILRKSQELEVVLKNGSSAKGFITSGGFSPTLAKTIAIARVPFNTAKISVCLRNKIIEATMVKYPFVRFGKKVYKILERS